MRRKSGYVIMEFGLMPAGTHFIDGHGRRFIKLKLTSACGSPFKTVRIWDENPGAVGDTFNAIDYDGIGGRCPDWLPFEIIKTPTL